MARIHFVHPRETISPGHVLKRLQWPDADMHDSVGAQLMKSIASTPLLKFPAGKRRLACGCAALHADILATCRTQSRYQTQPHTEGSAFETMPEMAGCMLHLLCARDDLSHRLRRVCIQRQRDTERITDPKMLMTSVRSSWSLKR